MQFRVPFLLAMQEQAPAEMRQLQKEGKLEQFVNQKCAEAKTLYDQLTARAPKGKDGRPTMQADQEAKEIVRAMLIEFPQPPDPAMAEPPDDLPQSGRMLTSKAPTSRSSRAT